MARSAAASITVATFDCVGVSETGEVSWVATITKDDSVNAVTTNLVTAESIPRIEEAAVTSLEQQAGATLGGENFDCGEGPVILAEDSSMICALTSPSSGDIFDATLTFTDTAAGKFDMVVAEEPRS